MRRKLDIAITALILINIVVIAGLLTVVVLDKFETTKPGHPAQASAAPSASASPDLMPMGLAHIPTNNACVLCHESGGSAGLKTVPALGHPLEGWRACLTCHTNEELGRKAPGHEGIAQTECLNCHKEAVAGPAITQPHSRLQDQHCLDCHGNYVHLPTSMASKSESQCTFCHKPTALPPPQYPHQEGESLDCRKCHQSQEVGALPIDHALRSNSTCLLCHDIKVGGATVTAPPNPSVGTGASPSPPPQTSPSPSGG
jgi:hypothetical protein